MAAPFRVGVVGTGALGRHHTRILSELPDVELVGIHDRDAEIASRVAGEYGARVFDDLDSLAAGVDAMVVAVPTVDHARVGGEVLGRGLHVMMEKPIAGSLAEADRLVELAAAHGRVLAVGHVEFFNPAVQRLLADGGRPRFVDVDRLSVFTPRSLDVDVVLDLMIHDLQIVHALDPSPVREVRAVGIDVLSPKIDIADVRLELESGCVVNLTASRVSPEKVRQLRIFFEDRYYSLDYQQQAIKGVRLAPGDAGGGMREIVQEELEVARAEPLRRELEAFVDRCRGGSAPFVDGAEARRALATALAVVAAIEGRSAQNRETGG